MSVFVELSLIVVIATVIAGLMRALKQPLIMGHILTGLLIGPQLLNLAHSEETIDAFAKFGISILLFIVGIGLSPRIIREVGKVALITGLGQVIFTTFFGYLIAQSFGYSSTSSLYIATALTFSSTIIILKLLSDKKDTQKLYGRISIGFLLVQDIIATIVLIVASTASGSENLVTTMLLTLLKGVFLVIIFGLFSVYVLPRLEDFFAKSQEFLFLFSIGWGLGLATLFQMFGFSIEIGALAAGVTLSISPYSKEIESKLKPLRDFFIIMFFVLLGTEMSFENIRPLLMQGILFSLFVLIGNPLIVVVLMSLMGYNKKTSFRSGLTVAQISEFSLILVLLGLELGHVNQEVLTLVTIVGLVTIAGSTYMIIYSDKIYPHVTKFLNIFEKKHTIEETTFIGTFEVVLFGCNRVGYDFLRLFRKLRQELLVVDFDPEVIKRLQKEEDIAVQYGDAEDAEFLDDIGIDDARMVISTIPDHDTNLFLLNRALKDNENTIVIMISYNIEEALDLYKKGATYVIMPHFIGGHFAAMLASENWLHIDRFHAERDKHIDYLKERKQMGHKHPFSLK